MLNPIKAGRYFVDLYKYSKDLSPTEIWNMDETNLNMEHRPVKASTPTHDFATPSTQNILSATVVSPSIPCPIGVSTLSLQVIPTYFDSPNHTGDHQNLVNFNDSFDVNVTSDTHPFLPDILSDNDAAEILASLTDSSSSQTAPAIVELESSNKWSGTWNEDLENIFSVKSTNEVKPKPKNSRIITSHRLLTSEEIINRKRKEFEEKEKKENDKRVRKEKRESSKQLKLKKASLKKAAVNSVLEGHRDYNQVVMDVNRTLKRFPPAYPSDIREITEESRYIIWDQIGARTKIVCI
ncbi:TBC1D20 [Mytilus coruscus]|uniref:TBC1D20 n=1 Tax=Mytilus coruscus TaxID=42192 RepID=A0A6J8CJF8_MYTCO|nr:TBC1D20 [Mytilus coruscus]